MLDSVVLLGFVEVVVLLVVGAEEADGVTELGVVVVGAEEVFEEEDIVEEELVESACILT